MNRAEQAVRVLKHGAADRPFIVIWEATQACPLACRHCRASARPWRDPDELSTGEAIELMGQVVEFGRPAPLFVITGGDPFTRDDLTTLVRSGSDLGLAVSVSPSGTPTLTRQALASLREAGARAISLSLDAAGSGKHDGNSTSTAPTANPTNWHPANPGPAPAAAPATPSTQHASAARL